MVAPAAAVAAVAVEKEEADRKTDGQRRKAISKGREGVGGSFNMAVKEAREDDDSGDIGGCSSSLCCWLWSLSSSSKNKSPPINGNASKLGGTAVVLQRTGQLREEWGVGGGDSI